MYFSMMQVVIKDNYKAIEFYQKEFEAEVDVKHGH